MSENEDKFSYSAFPEDLFDLLAGNWQGEGNGFFPTIDSFAYRETLTFERLDASTLFYMQRTKRRKGGGAVREFALGKRLYPGSGDGRAGTGQCAERRAGRGACRAYRTGRGAGQAGV